MDELTMGKVLFHSILPSCFGPFPILSDPNLLTTFGQHPILLMRSDLSFNIFLVFIFFGQLLTKGFSTSFFLIGIGGDSGQTARSFLVFYLSSNPNQNGSLGNYIP